MRIEIRLNIEPLLYREDILDIIDFEEIRDKINSTYKNEILHIEHLGMCNKTDLFSLTSNLFLKYHGDITDYQRGRRPSNVFLVIGNSENDPLLNFETYINTLKKICSILNTVTNVDRCKFRLKIHIEEHMNTNKYLESLITTFKNDFLINQKMFNQTNNERFIAESKIAKKFSELKDIIDKM